MLHFLIQRPIAVITSLLALLALSVFMLRKIPVGLLPDIPIPRITVQVSLPGVGAADIERQVLQPIRNQLLQVGGLADIESVAEDGLGLVALEFDYGRNTDLAFIEVNEKIDQVIPRLPRNMERPRVIKANVSDLPVFYLSVVERQDTLQQIGQGLKPLELTRFAETVVKRRIEQIPSVAFVDISGQANEEIQIKPYAQTLARLGVEESELKTIFQQNDLQVGSILVQDGQYQFNLRFLSELKKPEDIEDLYFKIKGSFFRLGDLAEVTYTEAAPRGLFKKNAVNGIVMSVRKQAEGNLFDLKRDMDILLADMEVTYKGLEFELSNDQSNLLRVSIDNLLSSLGYGALFAILILVAFFREWRAPLLIGLAVPIALVIALFGFSLIGITINTISLAGLILGVGLMVDNSIIVIENIRQYRRQGFSNSEAGVKGTVEVMRPLLSSALTTCSVFLPLIFLSGLAGALFYDQAISVSLALGASLLVAWLVLPTISRLVEKSESISVQPPKKAGWFERSVDGVLANKWLVLTGFAGLLGLLIYLLQIIPKDRFPELSRQGAEVVIDWNEPLNIKENNGRYLQIFQAFSDITVSSNGFIGRQQFLLDAEQQSEQELKLMMISPDHWKTLVKEVPAFVRAQWPKAQVTATPLKNVFDQVFGEKKAPLIVHFKSQTSNDMPKQEVVEPVLDWLTQQGYTFSSPANQFQDGLEIDRTAALRFQVTVADIEARVRSLLNQEPIGKLRMETNAIPVVLRLNEDNLQVNLDQTLIRNRVGDQIPLNRFIRFIPESTYKMVTATRTGPTYNLEMTAYHPGVETKIRSRLRDEGLLAAFFSGSYFSDQALIQELIWVLGISLLLLYLILAAQFESLVQPLIVLLTVPAGISIALLTLLLAGESLNLVSMIGLVVMSGIVVNDAILKVDMINRAHRGGLSLRAAIHEGGRRRLRPILTTTFTTILALLPILLSSGLGAELQRPLAYAVIGGLSMGTLASLWFVPVLRVLLGGD